MTTPALFALGVVLFVLACCQQPVPAPGQPAAEADVPTLLARIADQAEAARPLSPELNALRSARIAARLQQVQPARQRALTLLRLAREQVRAGWSERAIATLESLRTAIDRPQGITGPSFVRRVRSLLALAYLRLGEQQNCLQSHSAESCIFPLTPGARHQLERGSRKAMEVLATLLRDDRRPDDLWLYNLAAMTLGIERQALPEAWRLGATRLDHAPPFPRFPDRAGALGIDALGLSGGVIVEDFDGDDRLDVMTSSWGMRDPLRFFHQDPDGRFTDRSEAAGLRGELGGLNLVHADFDNDGDRDAVVLRGAWKNAQGRHPNSLLVNDGHGHFTDRTRQAGLLDFYPTQTAAWADFDRDGWLDLFVGNESSVSLRAPSRLLRNNGDGTLTDVAANAGLEVEAFVKGAVWGDVDNDGDPDLYLSVFGAANQLWRNDGALPADSADPAKGFQWRFTEIAHSARVEAPRESFPVWFWDYDNDGWLDLMVAGFRGFDGNSLREVVSDLLGQRSSGLGLPRLYHNRGLSDGEGPMFEDRTAAAGLDTQLLAMGANFGDLDNDGWLDAYFGTGEPELRTLVPNRMFRNVGGEHFEEVTAPGGFGHLQKGHGIAFVDLDRDGDQDIYAVFGGAYQGDVYRNALFQNPGFGHHWLTLRLQGTRSNRDAIGARVRVRLLVADGERTLHRILSSGGSFGSGSLELEIGLGDARSIGAVEVVWPVAGARPERFTGLAMDAAYRLIEGSGQAERIERPKSGQASTSAGSQSRASRP